MDNELFIGGDFQRGGGEPEQVLNPRNGSLIEAIPEASVAQVDAAVAAAVKAFVTCRVPPRRSDPTIS